MSNPTIKIERVHAALNDREWNDVAVIIDGETFRACAFIEVDRHSISVHFGDNVYMWASDALVDRVGDDVGLIGRIQGAIKRALA